MLGLPADADQRALFGTETSIPQLNKLKPKTELQNGQSQMIVTLGCPQQQRPRRELLITRVMDILRQIGNFEFLPYLHTLMTRQKKAPLFNNKLEDEYGGQNYNNFPKVDAHTRRHFAVNLMLTFG